MHVRLHSPLRNQLSFDLVKAMLYVQVNYKTLDPTISLDEMLVEEISFDALTQ